MAAGVLMAVLCMTNSLKTCKCCCPSNSVVAAPHSGDSSAPAVMGSSMAPASSAAPGHEKAGAGLAPGFLPCPVPAASAPLPPDEGTVYVQAPVR